MLDKSSVAFLIRFRIFGKTFSIKEDIDCSMKMSYPCWTTRLSDNNVIQTRNRCYKYTFYGT